jgi:hypothetical protein
VAYGAKTSPVSAINAAKTATDQIIPTASHAAKMQFVTIRASAPASQASTLTWLMVARIMILQKAATLLATPAPVLELKTALLVLIMHPALGTLVYAPALKDTAATAALPTQARATHCVLAVTVQRTRTVLLAL